MIRKAPLVLERGNDQPPIVVRVGQLWAIGKGDRKRRVYSVIDLRRLPEKEVRIWDGFGRAERAEWVPLDDLAAYELVSRQGNLGESK
jgi:hypothetical protein